MYPNDIEPMLFLKYKMLLVKTSLTGLYVINPACFEEKVSNQISGKEALNDHHQAIKIDYGNVKRTNYIRLVYPMSLSTHMYF